MMRLAARLLTFSPNSRFWQEFPGFAYKHSVRASQMAAIVYIVLRTILLHTGFLRLVHRTYLFP